MKNGGEVYIYDGSFDGLMCCVFEAFEKKERPIAVKYREDTILPTRKIITDDEKAGRVKRGITDTFGKGFLTMVINAYLSYEEGIEESILDFIIYAYAKRKKWYNLNEPVVSEIFFLSKSVNKEKHHIIEFLRFADHNGNLISVINPKYFILPLIAPHFEERYPNENFFIYDENHCTALVKFKGGKSAVIPVSDYEFPEETEEEEMYRRLWKLFYDTIEIKQRHNYALRMKNVPKRFWKNITELKDEL